MRRAMTAVPAADYTDACMWCKSGRRFFEFIQTMGSVCQRYNSGRLHDLSTATMEFLSSEVDNDASSPVAELRRLVADNV